MFITILEGQVKEQNWLQLEKNYEAAMRHTPDGLVESYLIHCLDNKGLWRIISVWKDEDTYIFYKSKKIVDTCAQLFCDAGTTPNRTHHHVHQKYTRI
jgi:quinol monooxygenase YgiN